MIESKNHVGELQWSLFPYYALTNWVAALRAYQLSEVNFIIRIWMVIGLIGGAHGHFMDFLQVLKVKLIIKKEKKKEGSSLVLYYFFKITTGRKAYAYFSVLLLYIYRGSSNSADSNSAISL